MVARSNGEFALLTEKLAAAEVAIPMQMNKQALLQNVNDAIKKLKADGTLDQMYQKWFVNFPTLI